MTAEHEFLRAQYGIPIDPYERALSNGILLHVGKDDYGSTRAFFSFNEFRKSYVFEPPKPSDELLHHLIELFKIDYLDHVRSSETNRETEGSTNAEWATPTPFSSSVQTLMQKHDQIIEENNKRELDAFKHGRHV